MPTMPARPRATTDHDELLARTRAGDAQALADLFSLLHDQLDRQARRFVPAHAVGDVLADTFASVLQAIQRGRGPVDQPLQYLMFAVRTTSWRYRTTQVNERDKARRHSVLGGAAHEVAQLDLDDDLVAAFRDLQPRFRQVIWWSVVEGRSAAEIGEQLGLSPNAAAALTYRARGALRRSYEGQTAERT